MTESGEPDESPVPIDPPADDMGVGPMGGLDLGALLEQAQNLQSQLMEAQQQAAGTVVEGKAGGGSVVVRMAGDGEPLSVRIDPKVVDPSEVEILEDLVVAAMKDANAKAQDLGRQALGGLGDLFGGGSGDVQPEIRGQTSPDDEYL